MYRKSIDWQQADAVLMIFHCGTSITSVPRIMSAVEVFGLYEPTVHN